MIHNLTPNLKVFNNPEALHQAAAELLSSIAKESFALRGKFVLSLSGGQTPQTLFSILSKPPYRENIEWSKTHVFWGDERCVPLDDRRNNALKAQELLLNKIEIPDENIHRIPVQLDSSTAAANYEKELLQFFGNGTPIFDLVLLGLGDDGHTASLFPGTLVLKEKSIGVRDVFLEKHKMYRITLTAPLINQARNILFLVEGANKAHALHEVFEGPYQPEMLPAQLIQPTNGVLHCFVDSAAAAQLKGII